MIRRCGCIPCGDCPNPVWVGHLALLCRECWRAGKSHYSERMLADTPANR